MSEFLFKLSLSFACAFGGYVIGRIGDRYGGQTNTPHHWIYGVLLFAFGAFYLNWSYWSLIFIWSGYGTFISDLNDFLHLRFYGPDVTDSHRFWDFD